MHVNRAPIKRGGGGRGGRTIDRAMYYVIGCLETKLKCGTFICHSERDLWQDQASNYSSRAPRLCHVTIIITRTDICYELNYDTALKMSTSLQHP